MKRVLTILAISLATISASAQDYSWRATYDVSIPMGSFPDLIDATSWRGVSIDNRWMQSEKFSVGVNIGWHTFYQEFEDVTSTVTIEFDEDNTQEFTVFGNQYRYVNIWDAQINAHYYFGQTGQINPWVGVGLGTSYAVDRVDLGLYSLTVKPWNFSITPQVGIDIPVNITTDFMIGAQYNMNMNGKTDYNYDFLSIKAGFKFSVF